MPSIKGLRIEGAVCCTVCKAFIRFSKQVDNQYNIQQGFWPEPSEGAILHPLWQQLIFLTVVKILSITFMVCRGLALSYVSDLLAPHESECSFNTTSRAPGSC